MLYMYISPTLRMGMRWKPTHHIPHAIYMCMRACVSHPGRERAGNRNEYIIHHLLHMYKLTQVTNGRKMETDISYIVCYIYHVICVCARV